MQLGVVDQSPIPAGSTNADALANTVDLARRCEALGYSRYWVAEHHASEGLAGTSPEILIGHLATTTSSIRLGSGGVMLTHYSPLKVAETFRMLCALYGERIDLGVGRAPGTDQRTMLALARGGALADIRFYPNMIDELVQLLDGVAPVWILASSVDSASYAAHLGLPLSWAYFITTTDGGPVLAAYRAQYRPSPWCPEPVSNIGVSVICGDTDADAERTASSVRLWRRLGLRGPIPSLEEARVAGVDARLDVMPGRQPMVVGSPERCAEALTAIAEHHGVDEVLVVTICHRHDDRVRSYELLAKVFGLTA